MSSELRVNKLTSRSGVGTVTFNDSGVIITGIATAATLDITGNATIAGVLSYDDVTNVDSVGIITARSDLSIADKIIHTGDTNTSIRFPAADTITAETGGMERFRIDSSGNMGLGTASANAPLSVHRTSENASLEITRGTVGSEYGYRLFGSDGATAPALKFFPVSNGTLGSEKMRIDSAGRLLLGTTTEGAANADDLTVSSSGDTGITIRSGTSSYGSILFSDGTSGSSEYVGAIQYNHGSNFFTIGTNGGESLRIDSSGRLLVGSSVAQGFANMDDLQVGDGSGNRGMTISSGTSNYGTIAFGDSTDGSGTDRYSGYIEYYHGDNSFRFATLAAERFRIDSSGFIGISSTAPKTDVDISQKTGAVALPQGTTAQRPSGNAPYIRKNTTNSALEFYNGTNWVEIITDYFPSGSTTLG